jgi:predicted methyltransferase
MTRHPRLLAALISVSIGSLSAVAQTVPAYVAAAVGDKGRPAADTMRDGNRKPALEGESRVLARPNDPHTTRSHEQDDQFIFRFRKPR